MSSVHVVLSVLRSRSLSFVHLSMSCRSGCMLAFAMFMSVCGAVIVMSSAYVVVDPPLLRVAMEGSDNPGS